MPEEDRLDDDDTTAIELMHAVVIVDLDAQIWLDVDGLHEGIDPAAFLSMHGSSAPALRPATEEDVRNAFTSEEITDEMLAAADRYLDHSPALLEALEAAASRPAPSSGLA